MRSPTSLSMHNHKLHACMACVRIIQWLCVPNRCGASNTRSAPVPNAQVRHIGKFVQVGEGPHVHDLLQFAAKRPTIGASQQEACEAGRGDNRCSTGPKEARPTHPTTCGHGVQEPGRWDATAGDSVLRTGMFW
jgi:hypothetical protein